jgi:TPR repeat protein
VKQDYAKAIPFYRQAAHQGCPTAAYWLAVAYENGEGVKKNLAQARRWYGISRDRGDGDAAAALKRLGKKG